MHIRIEITVASQKKKEICNKTQMMQNVQKYLTLLRPGTWKRLISQQLSHLALPYKLHRNFARKKGLLR